MSTSHFEKIATKEVERLHLHYQKKSKDFVEAFRLTLYLTLLWFFLLTLPSFSAALAADAFDQQTSKQIFIFRLFVVAASFTVLLLFLALTFNMISLRFDLLSHDTGELRIKILQKIIQVEELEKLSN